MAFDINTSRAAIGLFGNISMGSSIFYLTKYFRCILYSILLLIIILFFLFTVHFYDKDLGLMAFLSLHVYYQSQSISIEAFLVNFLINVVQFLKYVCFFCLLLFFISVKLIVLSGDLETNPGLDPAYANSFPFCHWNLNTIAACNFIKMPLLYVYNFIRRFDIICLSETYLDNSYDANNDQFAFPEYNLIKANNPNIIKRGEFFI